MLSGIPGCSIPRIGSDGPQAGTLRFANSDQLPHRFTVWVTDAPEIYTEDGETRGVPLPQRNLRSSVSLRPDETLTISSVFEHPVTYRVRYTMDGLEPNDGSTVEFNPNWEPSGSYLSIEVNEAGRSTAAVVTV